MLTRLTSIGLMTDWGLMKEGMPIGMSSFIILRLSPRQFCKVVLDYLLKILLCLFSRSLCAFFFFVVLFLCFWQEFAYAIIDEDVVP